VSLRVALAVVAALSAATVVGRAQNADAPPFPPPGRLVDVGGWRLHLNCTGAPSAQPTVVLEAGAGDFSVEWSLVQPGVARFVRVCSYDRAGDGWSELGPHPRTLRQVVYELHTLLERAGERAPFVLVGHSYGGWIVRAYAANYPSEVAGMVLIEGGAANPWRMTPNGLLRYSDLATGAPLPEIKSSGPLRLADLPPRVVTQMSAGLEDAVRRANEPPRDKLPVEAQRMRVWASGRLEHVAAAVNPNLEDELTLLRTARLQNAHLYGDLPLIVITRGKSDDDGPDQQRFMEERLKDHAALAALSSRGKHIVATRSGHHVQIEQPDLVVDAIREVVAVASHK